MNKISNVSKLNQKRIATILNGANHTITVEEAATLLAMTKNEVAKLMSRWIEQGWFARIKRGLYVSIKPDARGLPLNDPWIIATKIYSPSYIGALSAAEYWGFANKKNSGIDVFSTQKPRNRNPVINNSIHFIVRTIPQQTMFGLAPITRQQVTVMVSDPSRTIIDFMLDPKLAGGILSVIDIFSQYLISEHRNMDLLFSYAKKILNGAVLKRLGYLLERCRPSEFNTIVFCKMLMTTGNIKLDPQLCGKKLITRWGLWVPEGWTFV